MDKQAVRVQLLVFLVCAVVIVALITMQRPVASVSVAQAIPPEVTVMSVNSRPLHVEILAERALEIAHVETHETLDYLDSLTLADLDLSQSIMITYDQLTSYDGDYVDYGSGFDRDAHPPDRLVYMLPILNVTVPSNGTPIPGEQEYYGYLVILFADTGELLHSTKMIASFDAANPSPHAIIKPLPLRDTNGSLPLDYLLNKAYLSVRHEMPEGFTMEDMDLSQAVLTTPHQYRAFMEGNIDIFGKSPETGLEMRHRPLFIMVFKGGDFNKPFGGPPTTPTQYDQKVVRIWADTGQLSGFAVAPVGHPPFDFSPLKPYSLPFYIPTATPTP